MAVLPYKRVLVKLSGEALMGGEAFGIDRATVRRIAEDVIEAVKLGVEVAVVVGGGNIFRGSQIAGMGLSRPAADSMGMLATVMNVIALEAQLASLGQSARAMSGVAMPSVVETYTRQQAMEHLAKDRVVLLAGGTGNPFFTTDTGGALRAAELECNVLMKGTQVDGIYSADPKKDPAATRYDHITHDEVIRKDLKIMDTAAFALAREARLPIIVFSIQQPGSLAAVLRGEGRCTLVTP
ncbi:UMP kinase [Labrys portucalensis]|jgi:uridylate kinase|uniref:Uridylate kinase n=1 Tax=Labrys neptuniae TaxID=376174 RepID=A0ABV3PGD1_9HYPH|nr:MULTISPECIES: UMP kinase [Labrys]MDT3377651.1 UMP kinase [Labrys neptuniae]MDZ5449082.1 UMP kinase [Labrys sp. ZIDIC5]OCC01470.1 UMP kinase [Labrys sp. WJW]QEN86840.1 UMP kinase [Labrys sp. KNU-23]